MLVSASMISRMGARLRPATDTDAFASVVTVLLATSPRASAAPLIASRILAAVAVREETPHATPSHAAPERAAAEPPLVTLTDWLWVMFTAPRLAGPPGRTRRASKPLVTST